MAALGIFMPLRAGLAEALGGGAAPLLFGTSMIRWLQRRGARPAVRSPRALFEAMPTIVAETFPAEAVAPAQPEGEAVTPISSSSREAATGEAGRLAASAAYAAAFLVSASLHAGLGAWLLLHLPEPPGFEGEVIDAINIEIVYGTALEAVDTRRPVDQAGIPEALASKPGLDIPIEMPELEASQPAAVKEGTEAARPNEAVVRLPPKPEAESEIEAAEIVRPDPSKPHEPKPEPNTDQTNREPGRESNKTGKGAVSQLPQEAKVQGGSASSAAANSAAAPSANASPGERSRYAMLVRAALGPTRPKHEGLRGRVSVAFALSPHRRRPVRGCNDIERKSGSRPRRRRGCTANPISDTAGWYVGNATQLRRAI